MVLLRWLRYHEPEAVEQMAHVVMAKDFITHRLTGLVCTDESDLSHCPCEIVARGPSSGLFELLGIPELERLIPEWSRLTRSSGRFAARSRRRQASPWAPQSWGPRRLMPRG